MDNPDPDGAVSQAPVVRAMALVLRTIAATALLLITVITTIDVVGRYFFSAPLPAAFEMIQLLMAVLIFSGLPVVTSRQEHVTVGFAEGWFSGWIARLREVTVHLLGAGFTGAAAVYIWFHAARLEQAGEILMFLRVPVAPILYFASVMAGITTAILLALAGLALSRRG